MALQSRSKVDFPRSAGEVALTWGASLRVLAPGRKNRDRVTPPASGQTLFLSFYWEEWVLGGKHGLCVFQFCEADCYPFKRLERIT